jgi:hypothetical protein
MGESILGTRSVTGFSSELIDNNQLGDVYRHILFTAGQMLESGRATVATNSLFTAYDYYDSLRRAESETEHRDDEAGKDVGRAMLATAKAGASGDYAALTRRIRGILCDK